jgi:hypothetical protein
MLTFKSFVKDSNEGAILESIEESYGSVENFLTEAAHNIIDHEKYSKANKVAQEKSNEVVRLATKDVEHHLGNYGRSLHSAVDPDEIKHLNDDDLHKEREPHLKHLKHLYNTDPKKYKETVKAAQERLPVTPHGQNRKTATMQGEKVDGKEVVASVSNKGMSGSVAKIGKDGTHKMQSTCVNSKQSCRGEGPNRIGAPCLGMSGCAAWTGTKKSNTTLENMKTMKAHAKNGHHYGYNGEDGKPVKASPHLDYATLEHASLVKATEHAKKESEKTGQHKIAVYRQNTTNEQSAMHHDQVMHHLPDHLKPHLATNNYSATLAKSHYDPDKPSDASTHDNKLNNTNFSVKGPEVVHTDKGKIIGSSKSSNVKETEKALNPEHDEHGNIKRHAQNAYMVAGGHHEGQRLRYPKGAEKTDPETGEVKSSKKFHKDNAPAYFKPFEKLNKLKTARIYHTEKKLKAGEPKDFHHPDGWGHETHHDPHTNTDRTFEYQDHHVHTNSPKPDENGHIDFGKLNDNVGSDERKPKGKEVKKNKKGHQVGSIHISAATSATTNVGADGTHETDKEGKVKGDKSGVANDPFTFPIQHHIDKHDETRINLNHPSHTFEAEHQDKQKKVKNLPNYQEHPKTKEERGELK